VESVARAASKANAVKRGVEVRLGEDRMSGLVNFVGVPGSDGQLDEWRSKRSVRHDYSRHQYHAFP
jgi:hypothetical protein